MTELSIREREATAELELLRLRRSRAARQVQPVATAAPQQASAPAAEAVAAPQQRQPFTREQAQQQIQQGLELPPVDPTFRRNLRRGAIETAAGAGGAFLGAVGGPAGAFGRGAANIADDLEDLIMTGDTRSERTLAQQSLDVATAGVTDLAFGTGIHALSNAFGGALKFAGKVTGAQSRDVKEAIKEAVDGNLSIGAIDLNKSFFDITSRVGGVIPIVGGPIRTARAVKGIKISEGLKGNLDAISPPIDLPRLGVRFTEAGRKTLQTRRSISNAKYEEMRTALDDLSDNLAGGGQNPAFVPTEKIKRVAEKLAAQTGQLPKAPDGTPIGIPASENQAFENALQKFSKLPEFITPKELEALQKNLNRAARARSGKDMGANEFRIITNINSATWDALTDAADNVPALFAGSDSAFNAVRSAKQSWVDLKSLEETAAAGQFKRVDKNYFGTGARNYTTGRGRRRRHGPGHSERSNRANQPGLNEYCCL